MPDLLEGVGVEIAQRFCAAAFYVSARKTYSGVARKLDAAYARAAVLDTYNVAAFADGNVQTYRTGFGIQPGVGLG